MREASSHGKAPKENGGGTWERFLIRLGRVGERQRYFTLEDIVEERDVDRELVKRCIEQLLLQDRRIHEVNGRLTDNRLELTPKGRRQFLNCLREERLPEDVKQARSRVKSDSDFDRVKVDYEQTLATYRMLTDIRFKLLAFVPTISGVAITFLSSKIAQAQPQTTLVISLLGFLEAAPIG